jgi:hypothetical protein
MYQGFNVKIATIRDGNFYMNKQQVTLSVESLIKGYKILPLYFPATTGHRREEQSTH